MNSSVATIIDTMRNASTRSAGQGLATIAEVLHHAYANNVDASGEKRSELNRWLIVLAAVVGVFFVLRGIRKMVGLGFGLFWMWVLIGGNLAHLHLW